MWVPIAVPSVTQSSLPLVASVAMKNNLPFATTCCENPGGVAVTKAGEPVPS